MLLTTHLAHSQRLVLHTVDVKTKQIIKETDWIEVNGIHRSRVKIKLRRVGEKVFLHCTLNRPSSDGRTDKKDHIEMKLSGNNEMNLPVLGIPHAEVNRRMENKIRGILPELTDTPDAINTDVLTAGQLSLLQANGIQEIHFYFDGIYDKVLIKKEYSDALKAYVALVK